jgi:hypothetical protein
MKLAGGNLNLILGIVIGVLAVAGLVTGLVIHFRSGPPDNAAMIRPGINSDVELRPMDDVLTYTVVTTSIDPRVLETATTWWNDQNLNHGIRTSYDAALLHSLEAASIGNRKGFVLAYRSGDDSRRGGLASVDYDKVTGEIWTSTVVINDQYVSDVETYVAAVKHELGHAVFGYEDDPDPGIDLNSIMRGTLNPGGVLTKSDAALRR